MLSWQNNAHHALNRCIKHLGTTMSFCESSPQEHFLLSRKQVCRNFEQVWPSLPACLCREKIRTLSRDCSVQMCSLFCSTSTGVRMRLIYSFQNASSYKKECKQVTCCKACMLFKDLKGRFQKTVERLCCSPIIFYRSAYGIKRFFEIPVEFILFESCFGGSGSKNGAWTMSIIGSGTKHWQWGRTEKQRLGNNEHKID